MKITETGKNEHIWIALAAEGRSPEIPESAGVYGGLIGSWELEVPHYYDHDVTSRSIEGEAHFGWVLEGRAVQDVFIVYERSGQSTSHAKLITTARRFASGTRLSRLGA